MQSKHIWILNSRRAAALVLCLLLAGPVLAQERITLQEESRSGGVTGLALSQDSKKLYISSADGSLRVWDVAGRKLEAPWASDLGLVSSNLSLSLDGKKLLARQGTLSCVYDTVTRKELVRQDLVSAASLAPDGKFVALASSNGLIRMVGLDAADQARTLQQSTPRATAIALSADGKWLAVGTEEKSLQLWSLADGNKVQTLATDLKENVTTVGFTSDHQLLLSRNASGDVKLWDVATGADKTPPEWTDLFHTKSAAALAPDGNSLLAATRAGAVKVWSTAADSSGKELVTLLKTKGPLFQPLVSPVGKHAVTLTGGSNYSLWDLDSGEVLATVPYTGPAVFVREGKEIAVPRTGAIQLYEAATGKESTLLDTGVGGRYVGSSANGKYLATCTFNQTKIWDTQKAQAIELPFGDLIFAKVAEDGKSLAARTGEGYTRIWDIASGKLTYQSTRQGLLLAFSKDGKKLVVAQADGGLEILNPATGLAGATLQRAFSVTSLAFSPDSQQLAAADLTGEIRSWDLASGKDQVLLSTRKMSVTSLLFAPDSKSLLSQLADGSVTHWDLVSRVPRADFPALSKLTNFFPGQARVIDVSSDGKTAASGAADGTVVLWDAVKGKKIFDFRAHPGRISALALSPDGKLLVTQSEYDGMLKVWDTDPTDLKSGSPLKEASRLPGVISQAPLIFTSDSRQLVVGGINGILRIWDVLEGKTVADLQRPANPVANMEFSPGGKTLITSNQNGTVSIWDTQAGNETTLAGLPPLGQTPAEVALAPDGKTLACGRFDGVLGLWDITAVSGPRFLQKPFSPIYLGENAAPKYSPDGSLIALIRNDATIALWDVAKNQERATLVGHKVRPFAHFFSADGKQLVSIASSDNAIIWDLEKGKLLGKYKMERNAAFDEDSKILAMGLANGTVEMWDATTGKALPSIKAEKGPIQNVELGRGGRILLTHSTFQSTIKLWDVATQKLLAAIPNAPGSNAVPYSPNYQSMAIPAGGLLRLWDLANAKEAPPLVPDEDAVGAVHLSPGGKFVAAHYKGKAKIQEIITGKHLFSATALTLAFSADERFLAARENERTVAVWDLVSGKKTRTIDTSPFLFGSLSLSADGRTILVQTTSQCALWNLDRADDKPAVVLSDVSRSWLAPGNKGLLTLGTGNVFKHWDPANGKELATIQRKPIQTISAVAFSPDGKKLATGSHAGTVSLWDVQSGEELNSRGWKLAYGVSSLRFAQDGNSLTVRIGTQQVKVWNLLENTEVNSFNSLYGPVTMAPGGKTLATLKQDGSVQLWDLPGAKEIAALKANYSDKFVFSPDGKALAVLASGSISIRIVDVATGKERATLNLSKNTNMAGAVFTPDGRTLAVSLGNGHVKLFDAVTGAERGGFTVAGSSGPSRFEQSSYALAFAPDGTTLAIASRTGLLKLWHTEIGKERLTLKGHQNAVHALAADPTGDRIVTGGFDQTVKLFDSKTGKELASYREHKGMVLAAAISPDGKLLATSGADNAVYLRPIGAASAVKTPAQPADTNEIRRIDGHKAAIRGVAISPDGKFALSAGMTKDVSLRMWDLESGKLLHSFPGHAASVYSVAISPDGKHALSGGFDKTVILWDLESKTELKRLQGNTNPVWSVAFSADGKKAISASPSTKAIPGSVRLWDLATGDELSTIDTSSSALACLPDGKRVATSGADKMVLVWDLATRKQLQRLDGHSGLVYSLASSRDGRQILSAGFDGTIQSWDLESQKSIKTFRGHAGSVWSAQFVPERSEIISASADGTVKLWDSTTGQELRTFRGHGGTVYSVAVSSDGLKAISGGADGTLRVWALPRSSKPAVSTNRALRGHTDAVWALAFSPDGQWLATGSSDRTIKLWNLANGSEPVTLSGHKQDVFALAFTPDSRTLISGDGNLLVPTAPGEIKLWDIAAAREYASYSTHKGAVRALTISSDGMLLASGGTDRQIALWTLQRAKAAASQDQPDRQADLLRLVYKSPLIGHALPVNGLAFSADGKLLATVSGDALVPAEPGEVKLWNIETLRPVPPLMGHRCGVTRVAFAADCVTLVTSGFDESVKLWDLTSIMKAGAK